MFILPFSFNYFSLCPIFTPLQYTALHSYPLSVLIIRRFFISLFLFSSFPPTIQLSYIFIFIISLLGFFFILFYIHFSVLFLHVFFFSSFDFKASTWVDVLTAEEVGRTLRRSDLDKLLEILEVIPMGIVASQQQV